MTPLQAAELIAQCAEGKWTPSEVLLNASKRQSAFRWANRQAGSDDVRARLMGAMHLLSQGESR